MSGGLNWNYDPTRMTQEWFLDMLRHYPDSLRNQIKLYGKPRVRVPVERQTPNEADL